MSQIPCKQSTRIEMTGWFKHCFPANLRRNFLFTVVTIPVTKTCKCSTLSRTSRGLDLGCVVLLKVRIFFFCQEGAWEVAMLH